MRAEAREKSTTPFLEAEVAAESERTPAPAEKAHTSVARFSFRSDPICSDPFRSVSFRCGHPDVPVGGRKITLRALTPCDNPPKNSHIHVEGTSYCTMNQCKWSVLCRLCPRRSRPMHSRACGACTAKAGLRQGSLGAAPRAGRAARRPAPRGGAGRLYYPLGRGRKPP